MLLQPMDAIAMMNIFSEIKNIKILLIVLSVFIASCQNHDLKNKEYDWIIESKEYTVEELYIEDYRDVLVVKKTYNTSTYEKDVSFIFYLSSNIQLTHFIACFNYGTKNDEPYHWLKVFIENKLCIEFDENLQNSINDLELIENKKDREEFNDKLLNEYLKEKKDVIITINSYKIDVEEFTNDSFKVENGSKDEINIESNAYFSNE